MGANQLQASQVATGGKKAGNDELPSLKNKSEVVAYIGKNEKEESKVKLPQIVYP